MTSKKVNGKKKKKKKVNGRFNHKLSVAATKITKAYPPAAGVHQCPQGRGVYGNVGSQWPSGDSSQ